jgi:hypothetical protein
MFADLTIDFGNITVNHAPGTEEAPCGSPSTDTLLSLPAMSCGTNFDKTLDDKLGYYSAGSIDVQV